MIPGYARAADRSLRVENFRTFGADDRDTIQRALGALKRQGRGVLEFAAGRVYRLGKVRPPGAIFHLQDFHDVELRGNGAKLICETVGRGKTQMFLLQRCSNLHICDFEASDLGTDLTQEWKGMDFVHLETGAGPIERIALTSLTVDKAVSLFSCTGTADSPRSRLLRFTNLVARNCYYGLSFQENGDDVVGNLQSIDCRRAYFPYGVSNHRISLDIHHSGVGPGADACILISRILRDTGSISVNARFEGSLPWRNLVHVTHQPKGSQSGVIENIDITIDVSPLASDPYQAARLALTSYRQGQPIESSMDVWRNIRLSGCLALAGGQAPVIYRSRSPRASGILIEQRSCT